MRQVARNCFACLLLLGATSLHVGTAPRAAGTARLGGTVRFEGAAPAAVAIDMSADPYCAQLNSGRPVMSRPVEVGDNGALKDVVVYVRGRVTGGTRALPTEPVILDQKGCIYQPGVIALAINQPLLIRNSDATLHNVHVRSKANRPFNIGQPRAGTESRRVFTAAEAGITVSCDVHAWMAGAIAVFDQPYFAVTGADGTFSIDGVPPGEYTLEAWHPRLGLQTARVTVSAAGTTAAASFVFRSS